MPSSRRDPLSDRIVAGMKEVLNKYRNNPDNYQISIREDIWFDYMDLLFKSREALLARIAELGKGEPS